MKCPACKNHSLTPIKLEHGLPAMGCQQCGGASLSLLYYRDWRERHPADETEAVEVEQASQSEESHSALNCPKCGKIMTKFRIAAGTGQRLDLCVACDEVWLDDGEWTLLKAMEVSHQLPALFTDAWQYKVRREISEAERQKRYLNKLGERDFQEAIRVREWLKTHPNRDIILNFLNQD